MHPTPFPDFQAVNEFKHLLSFLIVLSGFIQKLFHVSFRFLSLYPGALRIFQGDPVIVFPEVGLYEPSDFLFPVPLVLLPDLLRCGLLLFRPLFPFRSIISRIFILILYGIFEIPRFLPVHSMSFLSDFCPAFNSGPSIPSGSDIREPSAKFNILILPAKGFPARFSV